MVEGTRPAAATDEELKRLRPFFDERAMRGPFQAYVCWIDVMGTEGIMLRSLSIAANFVMKLHVSALTVASLDRERRIELFPAIDGLYVRSTSQEAMLAFCKQVLYRLAITFVLERIPEHRFIVKAALSHGPVVRGVDTIPASDMLGGDNSAHTQRILLGMPLSQAHIDEKKAAPFGLYIHESARVAAPSDPASNPLPYTHYPWWTWRTPPRVEDTFLTRLRQELLTHYSWCDAHSTTILYKRDKIKEHRELMEEYFADVPVAARGTAAVA